MVATVLPLEGNFLSIKLVMITVGPISTFTVSLLLSNGQRLTIKDQNRLPFIADNKSLLLSK